MQLLAYWLSPEIYLSAGPAIALPDLKAQAEASDQKTDNLPSFKDIGASLNKQFGQTDPKDVGKAIEENTPGEPFLQRVSHQEKCWIYWYCEGRGAPWTRSLRRGHHFCLTQSPAWLP